MAGKSLKRILIATVAGAVALMSMELFAQAQPAPGRGTKQADRLGVIHYHGLNATELRLTEAQKAQINVIADAYLNELKKIPPIPQGAQPSAATIQARLAPGKNLMAAMDRLLIGEQRKTFEVSQQRRAIPRVVVGETAGRSPPGGVAR